MEKLGSFLNLKYGILGPIYSPQKINPLYVLKLYFSGLKMQKFAPQNLLSCEIFGKSLDTLIDKDPLMKPTIELIWKEMQF